MNARKDALDNPTPLDKLQEAAVAVRGHLQAERRPLPPHSYANFYLAVLQVHIHHARHNDEALAEGEVEPPLPGAFFQEVARECQIEPEGSTSIIAMQRYAAIGFTMAQDLVRRYLDDGPIGLIDLGPETHYGLW